MMSAVSRMTMLAGAALLLPGCAHVHVDADGQRHIVGFLVLTLPPVVADPAADSIRARTLGLSITQSPLGGGVVLGYSDTTLAVVRNHSLVPKAALVDAQAASPKEEPR
jgi:hypothetical protein